MARRIVVALDARPESLESIERTAALAADLGAEIAGLFVEDENLLKLCELPVLEVHLHGGAARRPDASALRHQLRARASAARRAIEREARRRELRWSFRVARGRVDEEMLRAGPDTHVVAPRRTMRTGSGRHRPLVGAVLGAAGDDRALDMAGRIARASASPVLALVPDSALEAPDTLRARIEARLGANSPATVAGYAESGEGLAGRIRNLALEVLVLDADSLTPATLRRLWAAAPCDLIMLGRPA